VNGRLPLDADCPRTPDGFDDGAVEAAGEVEAAGDVEADGDFGAVAAAGAAAVAGAAGVDECCEPETPLVVVGAVLGVLVLTDGVLDDGVLLTTFELGVVGCAGVVGCVGVVSCVGVVGVTGVTVTQTPLCIVWPDGQVGVTVTQTPFCIVWPDGHVFGPPGVVEPHDWLL
jgi:hypothetical protein